MDTGRLVERVKNIILTPRNEWLIAANESDTVGGLYTRYIVLLSALPAIAAFLKTSLIGTSVPMVGTVHVGVVAGLTSMVLQYVIGLGAIYLLAMIVNTLAPTFGGQKNMVQALKTTAYAATASWVAGILVLVPWLGWLLSLAGGIYSIYLLYLGLPQTMRCPPEKAGSYTAVTIVVAIVIGLVIGAVLSKVRGVSQPHSTIEITSPDGGSTKIDTDSAAGGLTAWSQKMKDASQKMEAAQKSGDTQAQQQAAGEAIGAMFGGGDKVEALTPEQLKPFVPDTLGGLPRIDYSAQRSTTVGVQVAEADAHYRDGDGTHSIALEITDMGGAKGLASLAGWTLQDLDRQSDSGYEKIYHDGDRIIHEEWSAQGSDGTLSVVLAQRFAVKLQGHGLSMKDLKESAASLNLSGLEALKASGVKPSS